MKYCSFSIAEPKRSMFSKEVPSLFERGTSLLRKGFWEARLLEPMPMWALCDDDTQNSRGDLEIKVDRRSISTAVIGRVCTHSEVLLF